MKRSERPQRKVLKCFRCGRRFGRYERAATIVLELYCPTCKGHVTFEAQAGELIGCRFEPKPPNEGTPPPGEPTL